MDILNKQKKYKVLFSDMDGTLIDTKSGKDFAIDIYDWKLKKDVIEKIYEIGIERLHIVSNQGGIEKGMFTKEEIILKFSNIKKAIESFNGKGYCPFIVTFDFCETESRYDNKRKPNTGMFQNFMSKHQEYGKTDCIMLGDASGKEGDFSDSDKIAAENYNIDYIDVDDFIQ